MPTPISPTQGQSSTIDFTGQTVLGLPVTAATILAGNGGGQTVPAGATRRSSILGNSTFGTVQDNFDIEVMSVFSLSTIRIKTLTAQPADFAMTVQVLRNGTMIIQVSIPEDAPAGVYTATMTPVTLAVGDLLSMLYNNLDSSFTSAAIGAFGVI
jgi:hypothetical protein